MRKVAVGGGSCGSEIGDVIAAGCDTFVTADLKYNHFEERQSTAASISSTRDILRRRTPSATCSREILREDFPEIPVFPRADAPG